MILPDSGISVGITDLQVEDNKSNGGEGGIRTPDTLSGMPVFKTGAINHSATSPHSFIGHSIPDTVSGPDENPLVTVSLKHFTICSCAARGSI